MTLGGAPLTSPASFATWVARYRPDGSYLWSIVLGDNLTGVDAIAVDDSGDTFVSGSFTGPIDFGGGVRGAAGGLYLVKLSASGLYLWDRVFPTTFTTAQRVAIVSPDRVAISGTINGTIDFGGGPITATGGTDNFVAAFSTASGAHAWSRALTSSGDDANYVDLVTVGGDVIVVGDFASTALLGGDALTAQSAGDVYVVRYRGADGSHVWSMRQGGGGAGSASQPRRVVTDGTRLFVGGGFHGTVSFGGSSVTAPGTTTAAFIAAYDAIDGSHTWSESFGADNGASVVSLAAGSARLSASFSFLGTFAIGGRTFSSTPLHIDTALARLNPTTGAPGAASTHFASSAASEGGQLVEAALTLAYASDRLAGVGTFSGSASLLGTDLVSAGGTDIAAFRVDF